MDARHIELAPRSYDSLERAAAASLSLCFRGEGENGNEVHIELHQDASLGIPGVLFDAGLALAARLAAAPELLLGSGGAQPAGGGHVLELGCGTACAGLVAGALGEEVICTDRAAKALQLAAQAAADSNLHTVRFVQWDWRDPMPPVCAGAKVVIATDCVYNEDGAKLLLKALDAAAGRHCVVLAVFKVRDPSIRTAIRAFLSGARQLFAECAAIPLTPASEVLWESSSGGGKLAVGQSGSALYMYRFLR